jgi:hypothetical protein
MEFRDFYRVPGDILNEILEGITNLTCNEYPTMTSDEQTFFFRLGKYAIIRDIL